jgi:hypothetical protein
MVTDTRKRSSRPPGQPSYWLVANNRETDHWLCWPERSSFEAAVTDARRVAWEVDPVEFRTLPGDDDVTLFIDRCYPYDLASEAFVWSWTWGELMPPAHERVAASADVRWRGTAMIVAPPASRRRERDRC